MRVNLGEDFYITVDNFNHTLFQSIPPKLKDDGKYTKPREEVLGYYKDVPSAIKGLIRFKVASTELEVDLASYVEIVEDTWRTIGGI